jgi:YHS domain-containing protein
VLGALPVMAGYCPVTLQRDGAWVRGRYEYRKEIDGKVFLTAGAKERDALVADMARYMPALGGDCVVSYIARRERVRGSVYHAYQYQGRLYLFADAERKAAFFANPAQYVAADYAADGKCVVTKIEEHRDAPGLPEFAAWHAGKLYLFAGEEQKQRFLKNPERYEQ